MENFDISIIEDFRIKIEINKNFGIYKNLRFEKESEKYFKFKDRDFEIEDFDISIIIFGFKGSFKRSIFGIDYKSAKSFPRIKENITAFSPSLLFLSI